MHVLTIYLAEHGEQQALITVRRELDDRVVPDRGYDLRIAVSQVEFSQVVTGRKIQPPRDFRAILSAASRERGKDKQGYSRDY